MLQNKLEIRELRSLKLKAKAVKLKSFFESEENLAFFMMTDHIQPKNRLEIRKKFAAHDLELNFLSKKLIKLWMKNPDWSTLKNLLFGNVVKITKRSSDLKSNTFSPELFKFILEQKEFDLRCVIWNQQLYRKNSWINYVNQSHIDFKQLFVETTLKASLLKSPLYEGLFFTQTHYR